MNTVTAATAESTEAPASPELVPVPLQFTASAGEYFRIWIVNTCLTLLTLGVFSAWAKVRRNRYFYGNIRLGGAPFHYVANPVAILKGRLMFIPVVVAYGATAYFQPGLEYLFWAAFIIALPALVVRARRFALWNTLYRNIRFGFDSSYRKALPTFLGLPLLTLLSLGLLFPYFAFAKEKFLINNARFGRSSFSFGGGAGRFYLYYLLASGVFLVLLFVSFAMLGALLPLLGISISEEAGAGEGAAALFAITLIAGLLLCYLLILTMIQVLTTNYVFNNSRLNHIRFQSRLGVWRMTWIYFTSLLAVVLSVGLLIPWAWVRLLRYRTESVSVLAPAGALDGFVEGQHAEAGAAGEEIADFLDLGIGL